MTFQQLLEDPDVLYSKKHKNLVKAMQRILVKYFEVLEKNPFLVIESLFRFENN